MSLWLRSSLGSGNGGEEFGFVEREAEGAALEPVSDEFDYSKCFFMVAAAIARIETASFSVELISAKVLL